MYNIAFARGGAHLPIAHALRLPETEIISWGWDFFGGGEFLGGRRFFGFLWVRGFFLDWGIFLGRRIYLGAVNEHCVGQDTRLKNEV